MADFYHRTFLNEPAAMKYLSARAFLHPEAVTTRVVPFSNAIEGALDPAPKVVWTNDWT